jgi:hypothetical protein
MGYIHCPLQLTPPTWRFLEIFGSFVLRVIFCALRFRVFIVPSNLPLQLGKFLEICRSFVSPVIICALQFVESPVFFMLL